MAKIGDLEKAMMRKILGEDPRHPQLMFLIHQMKNSEQVLMWLLKQNYIGKNLSAWLLKDHDGDIFKCHRFLMTRFPGQ